MFGDERLHQKGQRRSDADSYTGASIAEREMADLQSELTAAKAENEALREAMAEFVHRCEIGEVYSQYTYNKFKGLLGRD